jgi:hypothetical protein
MFSLIRKKPNKGTNMFTNTFSNIINTTNTNIDKAPKTTVLHITSNTLSTIPEN